MIALSREPFTPALLAELRPLILANHAATGSSAPLDPQWELLGELSDKHALALIVCRYHDRAVGYCAQVMHQHQLYGERWASCLAIYLEPRHRRHFPALVAMAEDVAREGGAACLTYSVPTSVASAFVRLGYGVNEVALGKRLD
jgi:GNAT superfamily N-acetyltransferase